MLEVMIKKEIFDGPQMRKLISDGNLKKIYINI